MIFFRRTFGAVRSKKWRQIRREHLRKHPLCEVCGGNKKCQVHHIIPFWKDNSLELEPTNLITLCNRRWRRCHFIWGHFYNYRKSNPDIRENARDWQSRL